MQVALSYLFYIQFNVTNHQFVPVTFVHYENACFQRFRSVNMCHCYDYYPLCRARCGQTLSYRHKENYLGQPTTTCYDNHVIARTRTGIVALCFARHLKMAPKRSRDYASSLRYPLYRVTRKLSLYICELTGRQPETVNSLWSVSVTTVTPFGYF